MKLAGQDTKLPRLFNGEDMMVIDVDKEIPPLLDLISDALDDLRKITATTDMETMATLVCAINVRLRLAIYQITGETDFEGGCDDG